MLSRRQTIHGLLALCVSGTVAGCTTISRNHGYVPSDDQLANVLVGVDTRETVSEIIGPPTSSGILQDSGWYYISSVVEERAYFQNKVVSREMVAVSFKEDGVVENIERFGLEDGRVITLNRRVTELPVKGGSWVRQLLGNFGNINPSELFKN